MEYKLLEEFLKKCPSWSIQDNKLFKEIKTKNWTESVSIVNLISFLAEKYDHHPELLISYYAVEVFLITHDQQSITEKDLHLAQQIETSLLL